MIGRPKLKNKKENLSLTIDKDLIVIVGKYLKEKNINKSEYVEQLLIKEMIKRQL